jgi:hypothetical protein
MTTESNRPGNSRSDQLRQKRQQSSQTRVNTTRQQVSRPAAQARTSATPYRRTSPYATPNMDGVRTAPVRKLHYAQGANGVEIRMPALPALNFNWQSASLFLAFSLLILVVLLTSLDTFRVSAVKLSGAQRVTAADVTPVVISANHSIFTLDRAKTIAAVQAAFPEFSAIQLKISFPNTVDLTVKERQPILAWTSNNQTQWIAADGVVMPNRGDGGTLTTIQSSVAVPTGAAAVAAADTTDAASTTASSTSAAASTKAALNPQQIDPQILQAAISLSAQLPSGATLVYDPVSGIGWNDPQGWQVYFGLDLSNIAFKEAEYQAISARLQTLGIKPTIISVAYVDSPYYRTE